MSTVHEGNCEAIFKTDFSEIERSKLFGSGLSEFT